MPRPQSPAEFGRTPAAIAADVSLCQALARGGAWRCSPLADRSSASGVYFYTRVRSSADIVVRHRWTHEGTVVRTVRLQVSANTAPGYRTFSHQSVGARPGQWEVALLAPDGSVIASQRFTIDKQ